MKQHIGCESSLFIKYTETLFFITISDIISLNSEEIYM